MAPIDMDPAEHARVVELVNAAVRARFALSIDDFVARLLELGRRNSPQVTPAAAVARLSLDDLYLAHACADGDEQAWGEFVDRHREFIHRFARRILSGPDATDLAADVIANLWQRRKIAQYEGRSSLRTWLGTVVSNAAINASKTIRASERENAADRASSSDPERELGDRERSAAVGRLLAESISLQPPQDRLLVLMYYEQGLTLDEIGPVFGLSKAALSRRLSRIRDAVLGEANSLAQKRLGTSATSLAGGLDLSRVDLDLRTACRLGQDLHRPT